MLENLRIHLIGIGVKSGWIIESFNKSKPDKVYLFRKKDEKYSPALRCEEEIKKYLKKNKITFKIIEYLEKDIFLILKFIRKILNDEKENYIYLNVSSGQRIVFLSFALSSILFRRFARGVKLYSMEDGTFEKIPSFQVKIPSEEMLKSLKFISTKDDTCSKKQLKEYLFEEKILKTEKKNQSNEYMLMNRRIIDKLLYWDMIKLDGIGKGSRIILTEEGQNWVNFYSSLIPSPTHNKLF